MTENDPLASPHLKGPGVWELIRGLALGERKMFDVVQVEVSSSCLARCLYCPRATKAKVWKSGFMSAATCAAAWPLFRQARRVHLQGWGEPFLHRRFFDFVALARRADCQVSTTSCGLVMSEETAVAVVESGLDVLAFSLAGVSESGNGARVGASFAEVCESIRLLQRIRKERQGVHLEVHIAYMALASQIDEMRGIPDLLDELDVPAAVVSTMDFIPSPDMAHEAFMPWERDKIARARAVLEEIVAAAAARGREIYYALPAPDPRRVCLEHIGRSLYIAVDGSLSPCVYTNLPTCAPAGEDDALRRVYGNVNDGDPLRVWNDPGYQAFREGLLSGEPDENCRNCPKRYAVGNRE